ncbi:MAG: hypothetical protein QOF73_947 [Thermomicrobiales bacterium]|nr:hypothetical protein [Thermomicrobiales bacterium]
MSGRAPGADGTREAGAVEGDKFDDFARSLVGTRSRRGLLQSFGAVALAGLGLGRLGGAAAKDDTGDDDGDRDDGRRGHDDDCM